MIMIGSYTCTCNYCIYTVYMQHVYRARARAMYIHLYHALCMYIYSLGSIAPNVACRAKCTCIVLLYRPVCIRSE